MKTYRNRPRLGSTCAGLLLAGLAAGLAPLHAGEVSILNSTFDDLAPTPAWSWENWSRPGSTVTYDASVNAAGGAVGSGSLRLSAPFDASNTGWQEAVFSLDVADADPSLFYSLSFDVKVDPASVPRAGGDYGNIQVILRNGNNWDWKQQTMIPLNGTSWQRVTMRLAAGEQPINELRAMTIRIAADNWLGTVIANLDNIAFTEEIIVDNFDDLNIDGWSATWGTTPALSLGADRYGRETSGSLKVAGVDFTALATWQQVVTTVAFPSVDAATEYTHVNVDVRVDSSSTPSVSGDYGLFEIKTTGGTTIGGVDLNGTEWVHLSFPLTAGLGSLNGLLFQLGGQDFLAPITYEMDNLSWTKRLAPPPPPTLTLEKAAGGLNLVTTSDNIYGRHNLYTADGSALGFSGELDPVTYSFTVAGFPNGGTYSGFQAHLFLVPGTPGNGSDPDWNEPHILFLDVKAGANGSGNAVFRWKVNQPGGNAQLYAGGRPALNSASVNGTWKFTVRNNTDFILTGPDGTSTPFSLSAEEAAAFAGPLRLYVGVQANNASNIGQRVRLASVSVAHGEAGEAVVFEDTFAGTSLDTSKWVVNTAAAGGVQFINPDEAGFLITWGLPDAGYVLQYCETLYEPDLNYWQLVNATPYALGANRRQVQIPKNLTLTEGAFFRLSR